MTWTGQETLSHRMQPRSAQHDRQNATRKKPWTEQRNAQLKGMTELAAAAPEPAPSRTDGMGSSDKRARLATAAERHDNGKEDDDDPAKTGPNQRPAKTAAKAAGADAADTADQEAVNEKTAAAEKAEQEKTAAADKAKREKRAADKIRAFGIQFLKLEFCNSKQTAISRQEAVRTASAAARGHEPPDTVADKVVDSAAVSRATDPATVAAEAAAPTAAPTHKLKGPASTKVPRRQRLINRVHAVCYNVLRLDKNVGTTLNWNRRVRCEDRRDLADKFVDLLLESSRDNATATLSKFLALKYKEKGSARTDRVALLWQGGQRQDNRSVRGLQELHVPRGQTRAPATADRQQAADSASDSSGKSKRTSAPAGVRCSGPSGQGKRISARVSAYGCRGSAAAREKEEAPRPLRRVGGRLPG